MILNLISTASSITSFVGQAYEKIQVLYTIQNRKHWCTGNKCKFGRNEIFHLEELSDNIC